jgi:hypothetical protein
MLIFLFLFSFNIDLLLKLLIYSVLFVCCVPILNLKTEKSYL